MALSPLDFKTNLSQVANVGIEQGAIKGAEIAAGNFQGKQIIKESLAHNEKVLKIDDEDTIVARIDENEENAQKNSYGKDEKNRDNEDKNLKNSTTINEIDDPTKGKKIDIEI